MSVINKTPARKAGGGGKPDGTLTKSWSLKESIRALRRSLIPSSLSQENGTEGEYRSTHLELNFRHRVFSQCEVWRALSPVELPKSATYPLVPIADLSAEVFASSTGPTSGLMALHKWPKGRPVNKAILDSWKTRRNRKAHGLSVSLYEKNPFTGRVAGEPNADAFVVQARCNSAFLAVADGVNWGRASMEAARCAIYSVYESLEANLYGPGAGRTKMLNTRDAAQLLFETFSAAQERIVSATSGLTTLCVALVLPITTNTNTTNTDVDCSEDATATPQSPPIEQFALIVASVGDSQAFLLSKFHGIREVTGWVPSSIGLTGVHSPSPLNSPDHHHVDKSPDSVRPDRDFRNAGGALGSVYKNGNPELNNLICAVTLCDPGDLVILGTDGLTDNFDPVITQIAVPESPQLEFVDESAVPDADDGGGDADSLSNSDQSQPRLPSQLPAKSWFGPLNLPAPTCVSIWPRPPPPPPTASYLSSLPNLLNPYESLKSNASVRAPDTSTTPPDLLRARHLNFTNQLELSWPERRLYAGKEMERVWHETDAITTPGGTTSSRDLCEALIAQVVQVTASKRDLLQDTAVARLRRVPGRSPSPTRSKEEDDRSADKIRMQRQWLTDTLRRTPGKLDHATAVIYEVGVYRGDEDEVYEETMAGYQQHSPTDENISFRHTTTEP